MKSIVSSTSFFAISQYTWGTLITGLAAFLLLLLWLYRFSTAQRQRYRQLEEEVQRLDLTVMQQRATISEQSQQLKQAMQPPSAAPTDELQEALARANEDIEIFLYKAYHNFTGPIASIRGICNVAAMETEDINRLDYFDKVDTVAHGMHQMLEQLLEVADIRERTMAVGSVLLDDLLASIEDELASVTNYQDVKILSQSPASTLLRVDRFLLQRAIVKMVANTVAFRRAGFEEYLELHITLEEEGDHVYLSVKDIHLKMPEEMTSDIFRMFYRGTHRANDYGLGLYIARYAIRRMGGDIRMISGGFSTTFRVQLPQKFASQRLSEMPAECA